MWKGGKRKVKETVTSSQRGVERRTLAVSALGYGQWYWVVWPSVVQVRIGKAGDHMRWHSVPHLILKRTPKFV